MTLYLDRSPLDRCVLKKHLASIYEAAPRLVVVDLDISPALWILQVLQALTTATATAQAEAKNQERCEHDMYALIQKNGKKTILMQPFDIPQKSELVALRDQRDHHAEWKKMEDKGVRFGHGELPIGHGIVNETSARHDSLSRVALCRAGEINKEKGDAGIDGSVNAKVLGACQPQKEGPIRLDFRQCIKVVELSEPGSASLKETSNVARLCKPGDKLSEPRSASLKETLHDKVVFFGARYGEQDRFLTLREEMYGVELHALGYASGVNGEGIIVVERRITGRLSSVALDLLVAFLFGTLITHIWRQYFALHGRGRPEFDRERAFGHIILLGLLFFALVYVCLWASLILLTDHGIWVSPVPIAIGMLIESFTVGSLMEALRIIGPGNRGKSFMYFFWREWMDAAPGAKAMILFRRLVWLLVVVVGAGGLILFKES